MICVFGDSIAFGMNDLKGGWVNRLKSDYNIINKSIPGHKTTDRIKTISDILEEVKPDLTMIALGINDSSMNFGKNSVNIEVFEKTYSELVKISKKYTKKIICIGLTYVDEKKLNPRPIIIYKSRSNSEVKKYDSIINKIAKKEKVHYLSMYDLLNDDDLSDGLHPNTLGHEKMYKVIKKELLKLSKS